MSLRSRLTIVVATAMAAAILIASAIVFLAVRGELRAQVDRGLQERGEVVGAIAQTSRGPFSIRPEGGFSVEVPSPRLGGPGGLTQFILEDGSVLRPPDQQVAIPVDEAARHVALGERESFFTDATVEGSHLRVYTTMVAPGVALQIARPLDEVDQVLRRLILILGAVTVGGIGLAAALGRLAASTTLTPVRELTDAAEKVAVTRNLAHRIEPTGTDELGRLASSFNTMLEALDSSLKSQRQLVADASHEFRTPLTSLRTNLEVLLRGDELSEQDKEKLMADVIGQMEELGTLMNDLIELARGEEPELQSEEVRLDVLAEEALQRVQRHWPKTVFKTDLSPSTVKGVASRLERAITNLLDNAAKWSGENPVEIVVSDGEFRVRDHGPGIASADMLHIFDRFYRAPNARGLPGSGIGLAIVRQIALSHGGSVTAANADGGGAILKLKLPNS